MKRIRKTSGVIACLVAVAMLASAGIPAGSVMAEDTAPAAVTAGSDANAADNAAAGKTDSAADSTKSGKWEPDSLVVNIGNNENSVSVTWFDTSDQSGKLTFDGKEYTAVSEKAQKEGYYSNRVTVYGLKPNTTYTYSIESGDGSKSGNYTYTTGDTGDGKPFSFAAAGDPQIGASGNDESDFNGWTNTLNKIFTDGNDYSFIFSLGDQINDTENKHNLQENQYTYFLNAINNSRKENIPVLANLVGNHDAFMKNYTDHYTMPNVTKYGEVVGGDGDYYFTYNGVLFMVLNSSSLSIAEHKTFLDTAMEAYPDAKWKVVCFHKSIYSVASHVTESDIVTLRDGLSPILYKDDIDVVLQGHDHVYARSYVMGGETGKEAYTAEGVQTQINNPDGVQYVTLNSASGSKFYKITKEAFTYTAVQNQERIPNYSDVTVDGDKFKVTTYRVSDGSVVDEFTIHKCDMDKLTKVEAKAPTYVEEGNTEYYKCDTCGTLYDANGKKIELKDTVVPATMSTLDKADEAITGLQGDEINVSDYSLLQAKSSKQTNSSIKLSWKKVNGAAQYIVYANKSGKNNHYQKLASLDKNSLSVKTVNGKALKKGTYYKFIVIAADADGKVLGASRTVYAAAKGGKYTNAKAVVIKNSKKAVKALAGLNAGKSYTVRTSQKKAQSKLTLKKYRAVTFESSDKNIANVNSKGKITGVSKGTCYIYAYAQDGVSAKIKVTVK